jgi:hypothetical protein
MSQYELHLTKFSVNSTNIKNNQTLSSIFSAKTCRWTETVLTDRHSVQKTYIMGDLWLKVLLPNKFSTATYIFIKISMEAIIP